jgi:VWFA-related protein
LETHRQRQELDVLGAICTKFPSRVVTTRALVWIFLFSLCAAISGGQQPSTASSAKGSALSVASGIFRSDTTILVHSDLVLIPVTVTDGGGRVVTGLEKEHFTLFEDNTPQEITHFAAEDAPASIGIVFDASDSMTPKMRKAREAVNTLLDNANPDDEFMLIRFSSEARVVVPLTNQIDEVRREMGTLRIGGTTALLDGVRLAMDEMEHARYTRKAIIVISDGEDNASHWKVADLKAAVRERDILIYTIGITDSDARVGPALLNSIASQTGGRFFEVTKLKQLPDIASKIGGWLRSQYVLGYVPHRLTKDGAYRKVELKIVRPKGYPRMHAVWRQGYYAPKE